MADNKRDRIDATSPGYDRMVESWGPIPHLLGGTPKMRQAGKLLAPQMKNEDPEDYAARVEASVLYPGFEQIIEDLTDKPFSKPVTLEAKDTLPSPLDRIEASVDRDGTTLTQFAKQLMADGAAYGKFHFLVDHPARHTEQQGRSLKDDIEQEVRPYFVRVDPTQLRFWATEKDAADRPVLTEIRIHGKSVVPSGLGQAEVDTIRRWLWTPGEARGTVETWTRNEDSSEWTQQGPAAEHDFPGIPLVTGYFRRKGYLESVPPLRHAAWLNAAHWASGSRQRGYLDFVRIAILWLAGANREELEAGITIGPSKLNGSTSPEAVLKYVEHTGNALEAGERDLANLETQMRELGMQPFMRTPGVPTATGHALDDAKAQTDIAAMAQVVGDGIKDGYQKAAQYVPGVELPQGFSAKLYQDWSLGAASETHLSELRADYELNAITQETYLTERKRRGLYSDTVDIADEVAKTEEIRQTQMEAALAAAGAADGKGSPGQDKGQQQQQQGQGQ